MAFCTKCGTQVEEGAKFCPTCGVATDGANAGQTQQNTGTQGDFASKIQGLNNTADSTADYDAADIEKNKGMAVLAYLSWLVLIPIFAAKDSKFVRFHVNQGLMLAITEIVWWAVQAVVLGILKGIFVLAFGYRLWGVYSLIVTLLSLVNLLFLAMAIIGIINVVNGKAKELPIIGKIRLIK